MEGKSMIENETTAERIERKLPKKSRLIDVAAGREKADLVIKNARYVNVFSNEICKGDIAVSGGLIAGIGDYDGEEEIDAAGQIIIPGLIDAHIHLESALVLPSEFAKAVVKHGTTTVVVDPHEIANVMGTDGIRYMMEATEDLPIDVIFMLPSCVPATEVDESGATLTVGDMEPFFEDDRVLGLAEMMNYPGVVRADEGSIRKILASQSHHKKIDGHAPGLSGKLLNAYIAAGVYSDHECETLENALEKLRLGQYVMIREGTAAKNLQALVPLLNRRYSGRVMFCTDDKHPSDLLEGGHIDYIIRRAVELGADPISAVKAGSYDAAKYFLQNHKGAIAPGLVADLVIVNDLNDFAVQRVIKRGKTVYADGETAESASRVSEALEQRARDTFRMRETAAADYSAGRRAVIGIVAGEIVTEDAGYAEGIDTAMDILKIAVAERHHNTGHIGIGYIKGYGLKRGAVATSVAHDSHNIIAVGASDADIAFAVNRIRQDHGGITVVADGEVLSELPLPIAGLISDRPLAWVNERLEQTKAAAYALGVSAGIDPFMTLSFMSLPVIPRLKITTRGVFDVENWCFCEEE